MPGHFGGHGADGSNQPGATHGRGGAVAETAVAGRCPRRFWERRNQWRSVETHGNPKKSTLGTYRNP